MTRGRSIALLAFVLALLSVLATGCESYSLVPSGNSQHTTVNERAQSIPEAPTSDRNDDYVERVALYFVSPDRQQLTPISRTLTIRYDDTPSKVIVERLLATSSSDGVRGIVPPGTRLLSVEESRQIVTVDLSVDAVAATGRELMWMKAAIANSLVGAGGVKYAHVLISGREQGNISLPTGAMSFSSETLSNMWTKKSGEEERFLQSPETASIPRDIVVYYPASTRDRLLSEIRRITINTGNIASLIASELGRNPNSSLCAPAFSEKTAPRSVQSVTLDDGSRIALIKFDENLYDALKTESSDAWRLFASVTLTLCRNVPELEGVIATVGDDWVFDISSPDRKASFKDGIMRPEDFENAVADVARLYFADRSGSLVLVDRVISSQDAKSPRAIITALIEGPDGGEDCYGVFPDGISPDDVLGIRVNDHAALVNLSSNFYSKCQNLSFAEERNLVYSIVNTLCEMDGVNRARFFINGGRADTLADYVSIKTELLPNPGIVRIPNA